MKKLVLRFTDDKIRYWSGEYNYYQSKIEQEILDLVPTVKKRGYIFKNEFILVSRWKSPRTFKHYSSNDAEYIKEITTLALSTKNEQLRIESLTLLSGINYPAASVILHFFHKDKYPIIDFRALWSIKSGVPKKYSFPFWFDYVQFCRKLSSISGCNMRIVDQALWAYSKVNQKST